MSLASRFRSGADASSTRAWRGSTNALAAGARDPFPPLPVAEVKALACELPAEQGVPLSRWSAAEIATEAVERGIVASVSGVTVWRWRWRSQDAIRPWGYRSWIFPRDPAFRAKAGSSQGRDRAV